MGKRETNVAMSNGNCGTGASKAIRCQRYFDAGGFVVGEVVHLGMFNGHVSRKYRVTARTDENHVALVSVVSLSFRNEDGTFSNTYIEGL
jgi:hypothetical protein